MNTNQLLAKRADQNIFNGFRVDTKWSDFQIDQSLVSVSCGAEREVSRNIINLQDKGIRDALIAIGWTPPDI